MWYCTTAVDDVATVGNLVKGEWDFFVVFAKNACEATVITKSAIKKRDRMNSIRLEIGLKIQLITSNTSVVKGKIEVQR